MDIPSTDESVLSIAEVFQSIQGEGMLVGTPAVFIRMAGCNMSCPWCDTNHEEKMRMTPKELAMELHHGFKIKQIVWTGGEPLLQASRLAIAAVMLHELGWVHQSIETNGTIEVPDELIHHVDPWVTCSPKTPGYALSNADELKIVYGPGVKHDPAEYRHRLARHRFIQPLWSKQTGIEMSLPMCLEWLQLHPDWRLSLQCHKMIGIR